MVVNFTTKLGLSKPTESELAENWVNNTKLQEDNNLLIVARSNIALSTYVPQLVAAGSNPNIGNTGSQNGSYQDIEGIIMGRFCIVFGGSGISAGVGEYGISLPVLADSSFHITAASLGALVGANSIIGEGYCSDDSSVGNSGSLALELANISGVSYVRMLPETYSGKPTRLVTESAPFTPVANDSYSGHFIYKKA